MCIRADFRVKPNTCRRKLNEPNTIYVIVNKSIRNHFFPLFKTYRDDFVKSLCRFIFVKSNTVPTCTTIAQYIDTNYVFNKSLRIGETLRKQLFSIAKYAIEGNRVVSCEMFEKTKMKKVRHVRSF